MSFDGELKLSPNAMIETSKLIDQYCSAELEVWEDCLRKIQFLEDDWIDSETFDSGVLSRIETVRQQISSILDDLRHTYTTYYSNRAEIINSRPSFRGKSGVTSNSGEITATKEEKKDLKSIINDIFEKTNKDIRQKIFTYLMRIRFMDDINGRGSFYDPNGRTKRGLYRNIMVVDLNNPNMRQDLMYMFGQHMFFYLQRKNQLQLIEAFNSELQHAAHKDDVTFKKLTAAIKSGEGLNFTHIDVKDADYKAAMTFFSYAFREYIDEASTSRFEMKKYYTHTYRRFVDILSNMEPMK